MSNSCDCFTRSTAYGSFFARSSSPLKALTKRVGNAGGQSTSTLPIRCCLFFSLSLSPVNEITPLLFATAGTPHAMAQMDVESIRQIIRPIGLSPSKAKYLAGLSKKIVQEYGGEVPKDIRALETLPGVGHKTARWCKVVVLYG